MFNYSEKTRTNKEFKLKEILKMINASKEIKQDASNIKNLCLSHVLSPATTNMDPSDEVKEIYIIDVELNDQRIPKDFIIEFDKQIFFQTLFRVRYNKFIAYVMSLKSFDDEGMKLLKTKATEWQEEEKTDMVLTNKLKVVCHKLIESVYKHKIIGEETISQYNTRISRIQKLQLQIEKQTKAMNAEKQPNIRMAMNDEIKKLKKDLKEIES